MTIRAIEYSRREAGWTAYCTSHDHYVHGERTRSGAKELLALHCDLLDDFAIITGVQRHTENVLAHPEDPWAKSDLRGVLRTAREAGVPETLDEILAAELALI